MSDGLPLPGPCERCGEEIAVVWYAPHELWRRISGHNDDGGRLCMRCFDALAEEQGILLRWTCEDLADEATWITRKGASDE